MTRQRKVDIAELEREYIYDANTPPVSFTQLAERHGVSRNTVAEPAMKGRWFERRKAFREQMGMKVTEAMGEQWIALQAALRERLMSAGLAYLAKWEKAVADEEFKVNTKDALGVAAMLLTVTKDAAGSVTPDGEIKLLDPDGEVHLPPDEYRRALAAIEAAEAGTGDDAIDAPDAEASGAPGSRPN